MSAPGGEVEKAVVAERTPHGIRFGGMDVNCLMSLPGGRTVFQVVSATGRTIDIYCSATGRSLRVFSDGKELKA